MFQPQEVITDVTEGKKHYIDILAEVKINGEDGRAIPSMYVNSMDHNAFYNAVGWGPMVVANVPPLIWFLIASILMIRKRSSAA